MRPPRSASSSSSVPSSARAAGSATPAAGGGPGAPPTPPRLPLPPGRDTPPHRPARPSGDSSPPSRVRREPPRPDSAALAPPPVAGRDPFWVGWLKGWAFYFVVVLLLALLPYPLQEGRRWSSPIFEPPGYLNRDAPNWLAMAEERPFLAAAPDVRLSRPLYPWLAYLVRRATDPEMHSTVAIYRYLNFVWFLLAAGLLRWWTLYWTRDGWAALGAGALFAASSFVQIYLSQPVPEILGAAAVLGVLCLAAWASGWTADPVRRLGMTRHRRLLLAERWHPWVAVGAVTAILMLGKELYALYLCLAVIGCVQRAWRKMAAFALAAAAVHLGYIAWVRWGVGRPYTPYGENRFVGWVFEDLLRRSFEDQALFHLRLAGRLAVRTLEAFWAWPVVLAVVGWRRLPAKPRWVLPAAFFFGWYALSVATNVVTPRICYQFFFPVVLPLAGAGLVWVVEALRAARLTPGRRKALLVVLAALFALGVLVDPFWLTYYG